MASTITSLTTAQIAGLSTSLIAGLTTADWAAFSSSQIAARTTSQMGAVSTTGIGAIQTAAIVGFETNDLAAGHLAGAGLQRGKRGLRGQAAVDLIDASSPQRQAIEAVKSMTLIFPLTMSALAASTRERIEAETSFALFSS